MVKLYKMQGEHALYLFPWADFSESSPNVLKADQAVKAAYGKEAASAWLIELGFFEDWK